MADRFEHRPIDFIGVAASTLVYVCLADRAKFDLIAARLVDHGEKEHGHVLTKTVGNYGDDEVTVVFQHWIKSLTNEAFLADRARRKAEPAAADPAYPSCPSRLPSDLRATPESEVSRRHEDGKEGHEGWSDQACGAGGENA